MTESKWLPPENVTHHAGDFISWDVDFFVVPSFEIGSVISADSTLKTSVQPLDSSKRWMFILLGALIGAAIFQVIPLAIESLEVGVLWQILSFVTALIVGVIIYRKTSFKHQCSFVGDRGIEDHKISGDRLNKITTKRLRFTEATDLYTSQTRRYHNGVYTGTNYIYRWEKNKSKKFQLSGQYHNKEGWPDKRNPWHYASAGERAWSNYRLLSLDDELAKFGYVEFAMIGNPKAVRVGKDFLEFVLKNNTVQRVTVADMKSISLGQGLFKFTHNDSRWWSGKGKFSFSYSSLPNAKLFLFCLDRLANIRWT
ncbi:MAG: hypothetical protein WBB82_16970 [Limnothrix sp.]